MSFWDRYPYTNFHEINLDWILARIKEFLGISEETKKIADAAQTTAAEAKKLAEDASQIAVPADSIGADKLTPELRARIATAENDILQNTGDIAHNAADIEEAVARLPLADNARVLTVGSTGARFATINEAITYARRYCSASNRVLIMIAPGTYNEEIKLLPNPGIDFIGAGIGSTIVTYDAAYPEAPLYTVGTGYFEGISFIGNGENAYALHYEAQTDPTAGTLNFVNCQFTARDHAGVGIGMGANSRVTFRGCIIETNKSSAYAIYCHNHPAGQLNQFLSFLDCDIANQGGGKPVRIENAYKIYGGGTGDTEQMYVSFGGSNIRNGHAEYRQDSSTIITYLPTSGNVRLIDNSSCHDCLGLDYYRANMAVAANVMVVPGSGNRAYITFPEIERYNVQMTAAVDWAAGVRVDSYVSEVKAELGAIVCQFTGEDRGGKQIYFTFRITAK